MEPEIWTLMKQSGILRDIK